jgi:hypothetical protein
MNINDELTAVDTFEERYGRELAIDHACEFLIRYLSQLPPRVPEMVQRSLETAKRCRKGAVGMDEVRAERVALATFLNEQSAWTEWRDGGYGPVHTAYAILWNLENPTSESDASELISNAFEATKSLKPDENTVRSLLSECFRIDPQ